MSVSVMSDVWRSTLKDATQVSVLVCLANFADDDGANCFPGIPRIAKMVRYSERTVIRAIAQLEKEDWISVEHGRGRGVKSIYLVNVAKLKTCQDVTFSQGRKKVTVMRVKGDTGAQKHDIDDNPPHPLIGVTIIDPSGEPSPPTPSTSEGDEASLLELISTGNHLADEIATASDRVSEACGVVNRRVKRVVVEALASRVKLGESPPEVAALMIRRWQRQAEVSGFLRVKLGLRKFFGEGYWLDENRWFWDEAKWKLHCEAKVGSWG
jgi:hypothetical protein